MHKVLVNRLGGQSLPRKSVVRLTDRPDMTLDVYRGRKTTTQQQQGMVRVNWRNKKDYSTNVWRDFILLKKLTGIYDNSKHQHYTKF